MVSCQEDAQINKILSTTHVSYDDSDLLLSLQGGRAGPPIIDPQQICRSSLSTFRTLTHQSLDLPFMEN